MKLRSALVLLFAAACGRDPGAAAPLRLGFLTNITHAQALVGGADDSFARELPYGVRMKPFNAGPAAAEALLAGSLDAAYLGAGPALIAYVRSGRDTLVIAGAASGGSVLVSRTARTAQDLRGARVASPQIGNTQDIALRYWLASQGMPAREQPGDVRVFPLANPDIFSLFKRGELDAAWVPEPWGARLLKEGAHLMVDERDLWPQGRCPTTVLVVRREVLEHRRSDIEALLRAHVALTERWRQHPREFADAANAAFGKLTGHPLSEEILRDAFSRLEPTLDPMDSELRLVAVHARDLGYLPSADLGDLVDPAPLRTAQAARRPTAR